MWELINSNKQKSIGLFIIMGICLLLLGSVIGNFYAGDSGWVIGLIIALIIWIIMSLVSFFSGDSIILAISKAKEVTPNVHPQLFNVVEEMKIASNLPKMPRIYIIPDTAPNAFATGRNPEKSSIAVTAGLLSQLNRDELQGVIAHETAHILNRDILFMTFSGVLLGSIVFLSHIFLRSMWFSGGGSRFRSKSSSKSSGQLQMIMLVASLVLAILAPIMARLLYFAISRKREYLADATAIRLTRYPEGLASALEKISQTDIRLASANKATAALYIANPLNKKGSRLSNLTNTHPPIDERIRILRSISKGANYINYQNAYNRVKGNQGLIPNIIPPSGISDPSNILLKKKTKAESRKDISKTHRDVGDLIRAVDKYFFIQCVCGLKIKIPPDFKKSTLHCPRCDRFWKVPAVELSAFRGIIGDKSLKKTISSIEAHNMEPFVYERKGSGWETFNCSCGDVKQISPTFSKSQFVCSKCGRKITIKKKEQTSDE